MTSSYGRGYRYEVDIYFHINSNGFPSVKQFRRDPGVTVVKNLPSSEHLNDNSKGSLTSVHMPFLVALYRETQNKFTSWCLQCV